MTAPTDDQWKALTATFPDDEVELLPKPFRKDTEKGKCDRPDRNGQSCGGYHGLPAVHLTYVGHAGITMRLNDVAGPDGWDWEPMALTPAGTPLFTDGGLWIRLTILGQSRLGYGDAQGKSGPNAVKEIIGDAIRNAAMRFGVGTYLWSKSERATATAVREGADLEPERPVTRGTHADHGEWQTPPADPLAEVRRDVFAAVAPLGITDPQTLGAHYAETTGLALADADEPALRAYIEKVKAA